MLIQKLIQGHSEECDARCLRSRRPADFFLNTYEPKPHQRRDAIGRKGKETYRWIELGCNDPDCGAVIIVRVDSIEKLVGRVT